MLDARNFTDQTQIYDRAINIGVVLVQDHSQMPLRE